MKRPWNMWASAQFILTSVKCGRVKDKEKDFQRTFLDISIRVWIFPMNFSFTRIIWRAKTCWVDLPFDSSPRSNNRTCPKYERRFRFLCVRRVNKSDSWAKERRQREEETKTRIRKNNLRLARVFAVVKKTRGDFPPRRSSSKQQRKKFKKQQEENKRLCWEI